MNDLRNALKKAGLIKEADERRFQHEERMRKKALGREGREADRKQQQDRRQQQRSEKKKQVKAAQKQHDDTVKTADEIRSLHRRLEDQALRQGVQGPRRVHYREPDGHLPFLSVSDQIQRQLEHGEVGIVAHPDGTLRVLLVPGALVQELIRVEPNRVLHFSA